MRLSEYLLHPRWRCCSPSPRPIGALMLAPGDPAPWFVAPSVSNPAYAFSTVAGRYAVLCFFGSAGDPAVQELLGTFRARSDLFNGARAAFFGISNDPGDRQLGRVSETPSGMRFFWDFANRLAGRYGLLSPADDSGAQRLSRTSFVLDPALRVLHALPLHNARAHAVTILRLVEALPLADGFPALNGPAPVLQVPGIFEPEFCSELIRFYDSHGGQDSGFMETDPATGRTIGVIDYRKKRRRDCEIGDAALQRKVKQRIERRLLPAISRAFCFDATRIERYLVACYDAAEGGYFSPHRDNTTKATAHRRFAVTINLNADDYEGGDLRFPEFGRSCYRAPTGGALVFSCSLLHEATPVTRGRRFCVLPFLYDADADELRKQNLKFVTLGESGPVRRGPTMLP